MTQDPRFVTIITLDVAYDSVLQIQRGVCSNHHLENVCNYIAQRHAHSNVAKRLLTERHHLSDFDKKREV